MFCPEPSWGRNREGRDKGHIWREGERTREGWSQIKTKIGKEECTNKYRDTSSIITLPLWTNMMFIFKWKQWKKPNQQIWNLIYHNYFLPFIWLYYKCVCPLHACVCVREKDGLDDDDSPIHTREFKHALMTAITQNHVSVAHWC